MMSFLFWVGLSATSLLVLAMAGDELVGRIRRRVATAPASNTAGIVLLSLVRAGAPSLRAVTGPNHGSHKKAA